MCCTPHTNTDKQTDTQSYYSCNDKFICRYLSVLYSLKDFPDVDKCTTYLKEQCSEKLAKVMTKKRGLWGLEDLQGDGTAVGVWGEMLGDVFQEQLMKDTKTRLSDAQKNVSECHLPFPIYTAVLVRDRTPTESYGGKKAIYVFYCHLPALAGAAMLFSSIFHIKATLLYSQIPHSSIIHYISE